MGNNLKKQEKGVKQKTREKGSESVQETGACLPEAWLQERGAAWEGLIEGRGYHGNTDHRMASVIFYCCV